MSCAHVREVLLELPDSAAHAADQAGVQIHVAACPECRRLQEALIRVDEGLSRCLRPPALSANFRPRLDARLAREPRPGWADWLPTAVHFSSCGVATAVCVAVLPQHAGSVVAAAAGITVVSHFLLTTVHSALDAAGD